MTIWTRQDEAAAMREGWYISHSPEGCDEILRHGDAEIFPSDAEAIAHVYWKAGTGSDLHLRAIAHTLRDGNSWSYERSLRKYKASAEDAEIAQLRSANEALRLAEEHINDLTPEWYGAGQRVLAEIRAALRGHGHQPAAVDGWTLEVKAGPEAGVWAVKGDREIWVAPLDSMEMSNEQVRG